MVDPNVVDEPFDNDIGFRVGNVVQEEVLVVPPGTGLTPKGMRRGLVRARAGARLGGQGGSPDQDDREGSDRKSTRLNSSHIQKSRMPSSA